jgi:hypothetical protein
MMRVDYTLPALQPGTLADGPVGGETAPGFRQQLRGAPAQLPVSWGQLLRLETPPFSGTYIEAPPRPRTLELTDAEALRSRWHNMIWKHSSMPALSSGTSGALNSQGPVQTMLQMLLDMQQMENAIVSQNAALTRG